MNRDRRSETSINDSGKHLLYPLTFCFGTHTRLTLAPIPTGRSLELDTSRGATSSDTFRSLSSWPVAIYSRDMLAVCLPVFPAGPAAAILSYSCVCVRCRWLPKSKVLVGTRNASLCFAVLMCYLVSYKSACIAGLNNPNLSGFLKW